MPEVFCTSICYCDFIHNNNTIMLMADSSKYPLGSIIITPINLTYIYTFINIPLGLRVVVVVLAMIT